LRACFEAECVMTLQGHLLLLILALMEGVWLFLLVLSSNLEFLIADRKTAKYADLRAQYIFQPLSVQENLGPFNSSTLDSLRDLGRRISYISGDDRKILFIFQRISVTIQRFNSLLLHDSFSIDRPDH